MEKNALQTDNIEIITTPQQVFLFWELQSNWKGAVLGELFKLIREEKLKPYELINAAFNPEEKKVYAKIKPGYFYFACNTICKDHPDPDDVPSEDYLLSENASIVFKSEDVIDVEEHNPHFCPVTPFSQYTGYLTQYCEKKYKEDKASLENDQRTVSNLERQIKVLEAEKRQLAKFFKEYPIANEVKRLFLEGKTRKEIVIEIVKKRDLLSVLQGGWLLKTDLSRSKSDIALRKEMQRIIQETSSNSND